MSDDDYYEAGDAARARRRRSVVTFAVVLLLLFFALWYSLSYIRADEVSGDTRPSTTASSTCDISPGQVEVNVYNATRREGLAGRVAADLKQRGFTVKTVANDPKKSDIDSRGQLRYGSNGRKAAQLVGLHTGKLDRIQDARTRTTIDVVLGPEFKRLITESKARAC